ncbi:hypothetical protein LOTGIDRAFT_164580 [Lottia gigantea]|uniref:Uncharacterized protein n=1 Tax=Lottia gigantea TaxID=225164 RepID=V4A9D3_LOTGI|nr:hypothetical protein LOTGIDRAFT_164580 [Lottia gigantea]ESO89886.1 hypothetical protein LOTGIDRAFT_164580 [Lottia gigantea]
MKVSLWTIDGVTIWNNIDLPYCDHVNCGITSTVITDWGLTRLLLLIDRGLCFKVNGQDLSNSTHEEAVEAFHSAQEPIVVEVLRRANKNKMKSRSPTLVSIGTQTEEDFYCYNRPPTPPPLHYPHLSHGISKYFVRFDVTVGRFKTIGINLTTNTGQKLMKLRDQS